MEKKEFIEKINILFAVIYYDGDLYGIYTWEIKINKYRLRVFTSQFLFELIEVKHYVEIYYESPQYDDFEQLYDELIIFKELILPKYL